MKPFLTFLLFAPQFDDSVWPVVEKDPFPPPPQRSGEAVLANAGNLAPDADGHEMVAEARLPWGIADGVEFSRVVWSKPRTRSSARLFGFDRSREIADTAKVWGLSDDITVVTVRERRLIREWIPNVSEAEDKAGHGAFSLNLIDSSSSFHSAVGTVDGHGPILPINQPAQLGALRGVFGHLPLQRLQPVALGLHFDDKVRTKMPEGRALLRTELLDPGFESPRRVGRATSTVREYKARGGIAANPAPILSGPSSQLNADIEITGPGIGMSGRYHNQFPFRGHFEVQIGMFGAKNRELLIAHGRSRQRRGQERVVNEERHVVSVAPNRWRVRLDADDITVVTARRNG